MSLRIAVIGAGIVGLATARSLQRRFPRSSIVVFERASSVAAHQTGRNSGVIHSGVYYQPGSLKAATCTSGRRLLEAFCDDHRIPWRRCGKVIVATSEQECDALEAIHARGRANQIACAMLNRRQLGKREPHVRGQAALLVADTGVVNYAAVARGLAADVSTHGEVRLNAPVNRISFEGGLNRVHVPDGFFEADLVVACCGLYSDRVARDTTLRILPFRGEYWTLKAPADELVRHLIYPVADPHLPFLGVHFTRGIDDVVEAGPSAVPALAREGYRWRDVNLPDLLEAAMNLRTWKLGQRWWRAGLHEIHRSLSRRVALRDMQKLLPELRDEHIVRANSGVRAQAVNENGQLVDDFVIESRGNVFHVLNAPSPAATACLAIGDHLTAYIADHMDSGHSPPPVRGER